LQILRDICLRKALHTCELCLRAFAELAGRALVIGAMLKDMIIPADKLASCLQVAETQSGSYCTGSARFSSYIGVPTLSQFSTQSLIC
jgi:hypothetical protein